MLSPLNIILNPFLSAILTVCYYSHSAKQSTKDWCVVDHFLVYAIDSKKRFASCAGLGQSKCRVANGKPSSVCLAPWRWVDDSVLSSYSSRTPSKNWKWCSCKCYSTCLRTWANDSSSSPLWWCGESSFWIRSLKALINTIWGGLR